MLPSQCAKHGREIKRLNHKPGFHGQNYTPSVIEGREKLVHLISRCIFYYLADSETKVILCRGTKIECVTKSNQELLIKVQRWVTDRVFPNVNVIYRQWGILPRAASRALTMAHVRMCPSRTFCDVILIWLLSQFKFSTSVYFLFYGIKRLGIFKINGESHRIILPKELFFAFCQVYRQIVRTKGDVEAMPLISFFVSGKEENTSRFKFFPLAREDTRKTVSFKSPTRTVSTHFERVL